MVAKIRVFPIAFGGVNAIEGVSQMIPAEEAVRTAQAQRSLLRPLKV